MKDRGDMTSVGNGSALPPSFPHHHHPNSVSLPPPRAHHDHRHNRRAVGGGGGEKEPWQRMPTLGADINLLANSLSSRLRKAARHKASPSSTPPTTPTTTTTTTNNTSSHSSRSGAPEESRKKHSKAFDSKRDPQPPPQAGTVPQSILKRTLPKEMVDQQYQHMLLEHRSGGSATSQDLHLHLPDVFMTRRWSSSPGQLDFLDDDPEGFNNQILDRPCPTVNVFSGKAGGGGGGGGGGGWFPSRTHTSNGHVVWIKRSGVFLPADKYAQGRQNLHGDDQPYGRTQPVDYETVTLPSRAHTPDSDSDVLSSGWSSGKGPRKKGLKVSWKQPSESYEGQGPEDPRPTDTALSSRQRSAGTVHSEPGSYSFVKPRFNPGKSRVPVVGVKWKVPTPTVGKPPGEGGVREEEVHTPSSGDLSGRSTPTSTVSLPAALPRVGGSPSKHSSHHAHHDPRHPWRALYPRDVHPVTTGLEREGTSVSKTMWQVPSLRPVPAFTFIEDLMEGAGRHWQPNPHTHRLATRATLDGQSYRNRLKEAAASSKDTTVSSTNTLSNTSDPES